MEPVTRRPLMLLAAGWILAALPAAAQAPEVKAPTPPAGNRRARLAARRDQFRDHVEAARAAIAARRPGVANDALERAETILLNLRMARAGADRPAPDGRAVVAVKQAREALAARDFAAADAALRPLSDGPEWRS